MDPMFERFKMQRFITELFSDGILWTDENSIRYLTAIMEYIKNHNLTEYFKGFTVKTHIKNGRTEKMCLHYPDGKEVNFSKIPLFYILIK